MGAFDSTWRSGVHAEYVGGRSASVEHRDNYGNVCPSDLMEQPVARGLVVEGYKEHYRWVKGILHSQSSCWTHGACASMS